MPATRPLRLLAASAGLALLAQGCGGEPSSPPPEAGADSAVSPGESPVEIRRFERAITFTTSRGDTSSADTSLVVPFRFTARTAAEGVDRSIGAWLARGGTWERFAGVTWTGPASSAPWRMVPAGPIRLVVGDRGAPETLIYHEPPRSLELDLGEELAEWTGPRGSTFRLEEGTVLLGGRSFPGVVLDLSRAWGRGDPVPGDWAVLVSGDSLQLVLESPVRAEPGTPGAYRGYGRVDFRLLQWDGITVEWTETRAFEPARRDVPGAWRLTPAGPGPAGELEVVGAELAAGEGEGPVLPVEGLFTVAGFVELEGRRYPVRGFFRHARD